MRRSPNSPPTSAPISRSARACASLGLFDAARLRPHHRRGLALLEDFGSETIVDANGVNPSRYAEAAALLADMHMRALPRELLFAGESHTLPVYDLDAMLIEVELALDWYAPAIARGAPSSGARMQFLGLWREILSPPLAGPLTWTLARLSFAQPSLARRAQRTGALGPD